MTKYKWSFLGLIVSIILFLVFLISPLIDFIDNAIIPAEPRPNELIPSYENTLIKYIEIEHENPFIEYAETNKEIYQEWIENVPKKFNRYALSDFGKSFYHWNLFWIPIIIFSVLMVNYKKEP
jgi:hypothetical protein